MRQSLPDLGSHVLRQADMGHGPDGRLGIERVAELLGVHPGRRSFHEGIEHTLMHIDLFDSAAALARVEHGAVHQSVDCGVKIGIWASVARILPAELRGYRDEDSRRTWAWPAAPITRWRTWRSCAAPNLTVLVPADAHQTWNATLATEGIDRPVYIRLGGRVDEPPVTPVDATLRVGEAELMRDGRDVTVIACGCMVVLALEAAVVFTVIDS